MEDFTTYAINMWKLTGKLADVEIRHVTLVVSKFKFNKLLPIHLASVSISSYPNSKTENSTKYTEQQQIYNLGICKEFSGKPENCAFNKKYSLYELFHFGIYNIEYVVNGSICT